MKFLKWYCKLIHIIFEHIKWLARFKKFPVPPSTIVVIVKFNLEKIVCACCHFFNHQKRPTKVKNKVKDPVK